MERAHKIRLNPTPEQEQYFKQASGNARFTWNWALAIMRQARAEQTDLPMVGDLKAKFNRIKREQFPFVMETTKWANRTTVCRLEPGSCELLERHQETQKWETSQGWQAGGLPEIHVTQAWIWIVLSGKRQVHGRRALDTHTETWMGEYDRTAALFGQDHERTGQ
jgi:transposase